jgi:hypothetical protein
MIPEPTTAATRKAVPVNSAVTRLARAIADCVVIF